MSFNLCLNTKRAHTLNEEDIPCVNIKIAFEIESMTLKTA